MPNSRNAFLVELLMIDNLGIIKIKYFETAILSKIL